ncbi:MAG TPA: ABC transporter ATP-binding protein [Streptosporangiaceae bacterium]|nr:ABC transporter ATP-binding protein [Streptosporangiaceae bacterium]
MLLRLLRTVLRPYAKQASLMTALQVIQVAGILYLPDLNADIINTGVVNGNVGYIWRTGSIMVGIAAVLGVVSVAAVYLAARISMAVGADLRALIYQRVQYFSAQEMSRFGIPSLVTRSINDVQQVQEFLQLALMMLITAVIMSIGAMFMAVREGPTLSFVLLVAIAVMVLTIGAMAITLVPLFRSRQVKVDRINQVLREQITGVRVIRAFRRTRYEQDRFREANLDVTRTALRANRIFAAAMPIVLGIANLSSVGVIWFGGRLVSEGSMSIGNMTAFLIYILMILTYVVIATSVIILAPSAVASAERIGPVINAIPVITDPPRPMVPDTVTGTVEFHHVTFGYPGSERPVLNDLTFTFRPGQISAIIGGTGSGKTTLLNLILRFFDASSGTVLVNGIDVRDQDAEELWSAIGLVPQAAFLFGGTVASNLRFGVPEATDEQLWHALDVAQARDFVASMPGLLSAPIDHGGTNVSGGQRQRLSIARALVRCPRLYLFDDCFSALDAVTDARLRGALRAQARDAAVVIVSQRASAVMHADQIIVLDAGSIAGAGTHEELLADCPTYEEIVASQLGEGAAA